jgi:hypothetical protein
MDHEIMAYIHKGYYSATRNNDMGFEGKWMQRKDIILSEVRIRNTKDTCFLSYVEDGSKDKHIPKNKHDHIQNCRIYL